MTDIRRVQVLWSGFIGSPGFTNFYLLDGGIDVIGKIAQFWTNRKAALPNDVTITVPAVGETFNAETGALIGAWELTGGQSMQGTGGANYAAPVGCVINWRTGSINRGRKVRGRTFLVPLASVCFAVDGSLVDEVKASMQGAADTLVSDLAGTLAVWSRPRGTKGVPNSGVGGLAAPVTSAHVPDLAAVLRSRRD